MDQPLNSAVPDAIYSIIKESIERNINTSEILREVKIDIEYQKSTSKAMNMDTILDRLLDTWLRQIRTLLLDSRNDWSRHHSGSAIIEDEVKLGRETCVRQAPAANTKDATTRKKKKGTDAAATRAAVVEAEPRSAPPKKIESKATDFEDLAIERGSKKVSAILRKGKHIREVTKAPSS